MTRSKGRPFVKKDPRINRKGRPPTGETWAGTLRALAELSGPEVAGWVTTQANEFAKLPKGVPLKVMVCLWAYASLSRDFNAAVFKEIIDRTDGPLNQYESRLRALEELLNAKERNNG